VTGTLTDDARSGEGPGEVRRDAEPHRGHVLVVLGAVSLWCGLLSFLLVVPSLLGLPLGVAVFVMARRDLGKMRAGRMDCRGVQTTAHGHNLGFAGVVINLIAPLVLPGMWLVVWLSLP
jgi:hypothetical protein